MYEHENIIVKAVLDMSVMRGCPVKFHHVRKSKCVLRVAFWISNVMKLEIRLTSLNQVVEKLLQEGRNIDFNDKYSARFKSKDF